MSCKCYVEFGNCVGSYIQYNICIKSPSLSIIFPLPFIFSLLFSFTLILMKITTVITSSTIRIHFLITKNIWKSTEVQLPWVQIFYTSLPKFLRNNIFEYPDKTVLYNPYMREELTILMFQIRILYPWKKYKKNFSILQHGFTLD